MGKDQNIPPETLKEGVPDGNSSFLEDKGAPVVQPEPGKFPLKNYKAKQSWKFIIIHTIMAVEPEMEHKIEWDTHVINRN